MISHQQVLGAGVVLININVRACRISAATGSGAALLVDDGSMALPPPDLPSKRRCGCGGRSQQAVVHACGDGAHGHVRVCLAHHQYDAAPDI